MKISVPLILALTLLPLLAKSALINRPIESTTRSQSFDNAHQSNYETPQSGDEHELQVRVQELINRFVVVGEQPTETTQRTNDEELSTRTTPDLAVRSISFASIRTAIEGRTVAPNVATDSLNYVVDDTEYEQLLSRLALEAEDSITANRANYVADDADMEEIIRRLELEQNSTTVGPTDATTGLEERQQGDAFDNITPTSVGGDDSSKNVDESEPNGDDECPICYEPFGDEELDITLCAHKFHKRCMDSWKRTNYDQVINCPMCRSSLFGMSSWGL